MPHAYVIHTRISIHALHAECDFGIRFFDRIGEFQSTHSMRSATAPPRFMIACENFNPRTPCGVRRQRGRLCRPRDRFQSTHSMRSATRASIDTAQIVKFQSTHSMRSATLPVCCLVINHLFISIHALHAECDRCQPGAPAGGRISIHALHAECDLLKKEASPHK